MVRCAGINAIYGRIVCWCCMEDLGPWSGKYDDAAFEVVTPGGLCWRCGFGRCDHGDPGCDYDPRHEAIGNEREPCPECGEVGACGFDQEGRPLIHAISWEDT